MPKFDLVFGYGEFVTVVADAVPRVGENVGLCRYAGKGVSSCEPWVVAYVEHHFDLDIDTPGLIGHAPGHNILVHLKKDTGAADADN